MPDDLFHDALHAAIRSNEQFEGAAGAKARSEKVKRDSDELVQTLRELIDASKRLSDKQARPSA